MIGTIPVTDIINTSIEMTNGRNTKTTNSKQDKHEQLQNKNPNYTLHTKQQPKRPELSSRRPP